VLTRDQNQLFAEALHIQNCELALGEYYQLLAEKQPNEKEFWEQAIIDEVNYARRIGRIIAMISSRPAKFSPGKYRLAVLDTFITGIFEHIELLRDNKLTRPEVMKIALDYENSLIISRPYDVVDSYDSEFKEYKAQFAETINLHTERMKQYLRKMLNLTAEAHNLHQKSI
jgi:hypothetical protein